MTVIRKTLQALSALALAASAQAQIVNIDAATSAGTVLDLAPGDYVLGFAAAADGAAYLGWNPGASATQSGWVDTFAIDVDGATRTFAAIGGVHADVDATASASTFGLYEVLDDGTLAASATNGLHLDAAAQLRFHVDDRYYADNIGGVSIKVAPWHWIFGKPGHPTPVKPAPTPVTPPVVAAVPEPSQVALLLAGLGVVGLVAHRRRA